MNSIRVRPARAGSSSNPITRVLAIEPDAARAEVLRDVLLPRLDADLVIVKGIADAMHSIAGAIPDLVLTSTFLAPADEAVLAAHFKQIPAAAHVQIVNVPYFIDVDSEEQTRSPRSKWKAILGRRAPAIRPKCDVETLHKQIEDYLSYAAATRAEQRQAPPSVVAPPPRKIAALSLAPKPQPVEPAVTVTLAGKREVRLQFDPRRDRRRRRRLRGNEMSWLWTVRLPWGDAIRIVDISNSGVLLESTSKVTPGTTIDLQLLGEGTNVFVPARAIRTDVADVDGSGVRYRLAAAFSHEVVLPGADAPRRDVSEPSPRALADLLTRVLNGVERTPRSSKLRARFESELRQLLHLRDVQIRETPVIPDQGSESIYFTIPQISGAKRIMQVIFAPGDEPSELDFKLLKAAATAAALVLEFAPLIEVPDAGLRLLRA